MVITIPAFLLAVGGGGVFGGGGAAGGGGDDGGVGFIFPTLLRGEELYTQMGFFLFREFSPLGIFIVES